MDNLKSHDCAGSNKAAWEAYMALQNGSQRAHDERLTDTSAGIPACGEASAETVATDFSIGALGLVTEE